MNASPARAVGRPPLSAALRRRILRARKTGRLREFQLMLALRQSRPAVVAEGDSWFAYPPRHLLPTGAANNVVTHLSRMAPMNLLQLASNGDEAVQMLSGAAKHRLLRILARFPVDILLFSGGGNDLVGCNDFDFMLRDGSRVRSDDPLDYLQGDRLQRRLSLVEVAYRDLLDYCGVYSRNPGIRVVTHCYDYASPSPRGARFAGGLIRPQGGRSWMHPALVGRKVPARHHQGIARHVIDALAHRLLGLQAEFPDRLVVVDTRGLLEGRDWADEIHPGPAGFGRLAGAILATLGHLDGRFRPAMERSD